MTANPTFGYCVEAPIAWPGLLALAKELDRNSRFDSFWMPDAITAHDAAKLEPFTVLAAVAQATTRLRLGTLVAGNAFRHPAVLAQTVATLDQISGGRLTLGIGAGWPGDNRKYGIEFWRRPERIARLDEALQVMKKLWTEDRPTFAGKYYILEAPPYRIETLQQPHPPILIGGGDDALLRIIAQHADLASPMIPIAEAKPKIAAACRELNRNIDQIRWTGGGTLFLHDDPNVERMAINYAIEHFGGTEESIRAGGLFGNTDTVRQRVADQIAEGCTDIIVFQLPRVHMKSLMRFSDDIIPSFV
jgi:alkanesulfonate monooxygenase SsuD/methylene tetrahydromethanopterin reductase-like flavin-dependent oxidoreductase (luciferase family)